MRALTLWPEWAWAIHTLDKRVENRTWAIPRGEWFALHAGKHIGGRPGEAARLDGLNAVVHMGRRAGWACIVDRAGVNTQTRTFTVSADAIARSCLLGHFRVTDYDRSGLGWAVPGQIGNVLEYVPFAEPVPCKGAQGLWRVPEDVMAKIKETK